MTDKNDIQLEDIEDTEQEQLDEEVLDHSSDESDIHTDCSEKVEQAENKYKRAIADYQNLEKRVREERGDLIRSSNKELLLRFLPILDTLVLADQHEENSTVKIVIDQFLGTLKSEGLVKVEVLGKKFDPLTMEVVTTGDGKEGVVIQEVRTGYLLHDKLLRPAQVIVGSAK